MPFKRYPFVRQLVKVLLVLAWCLAAAAVVWAEEEAGERRPMGFWDIILMPKVWIAAIFCAVGLILLATSKARRKIRLVWLGIAFVAFGVLGALPLGSLARGMGMHPSPVCTITRPFQFLDAGRTIPLMFFVFMGLITVLSLAGNKLYCGWVCPLGALQEATHRLPVARKLRVTLPFRVTNPIRILTFAVFLVVVFITGTSIYDYFNPFEGLHWGFDVIATTALVGAVIAAVFVFRPFCYLLCPIGLYTWLLEHISLTKLRLKRDDCTMCKICVKKTNCPAVQAILDGKRSRPDCHACGDCMDVCPTDALVWK